MPGTSAIETEFGKKYAQEIAQIGVFVKSNMGDDPSTLQDNMDIATQHAGRMATLEAEAEQQFFAKLKQIKEQNPSMPVTRLDHMEKTETVEERYWRTLTSNYSSRLSDRISSIQSRLRKLNP